MSLRAVGEVALTNGVIATLEPALPRAEAILIRDGRIVHVGTTREVLDRKGPKCEVIDLAGKLALPGLIESHMHPTMFGTSLLEVSARFPEVRSVRDIQGRVKERADTRPPGAWILGWGYDDSRLNEKRHLTRWDLDAVAQEHPVYIRRTCGHMGVANSRALALAGITAATSDPEGGHIDKDPATGEPTGLLQESAQNLLPIPPYTEQDAEEGLRLGLGRLAAYGLTTVHDMSGNQLGLRAFQNMAAKGTLPTRIRTWLAALPMAGIATVPLLPSVLQVGLKSGFGDDMVKFMGMKFLLDGSIGGRTAAVDDEYVGEPGNRGILYLEQGELDESVAVSLRNGLRVAIHAIGERAIEQAIRSLEAASKTVPLAIIRGMRNRIEHCSLPTVAQIKRMKDVGLLASVSVAFIYWLGDSQKAALGKERLARLYPCRTLSEVGVPFANNSDCPVCDANPFCGLYAAVNRTTDTGQVLDNVQNVTIEEAIAMYTRQAAYFSFEEDRLGTLKPGKLGDVIVLPQNIYEMPPEQIKDLRVEMTFVGGRRVYPG